MREQNRLSMLCEGIDWRAPGRTDLSRGALLVGPHQAKANPVAAGDRERRDAADCDA
jgi:hypothetical protein